MNAVNALSRRLRPGRVYRRAELAQWSKSADRSVRELVASGKLKKLGHGTYWCPKDSVFGELPPSDNELVRAFLKDDQFLLMSPNDYNLLGVGTTQLYNKRVVYNHKRLGEFELGGKRFEFRRRVGFPRALSKEFLVVDLLNNLNNLEEDQEAVRAAIKSRLSDLQGRALKWHAKSFGKVATKKFVSEMLSHGR